MPTWPPCWEKCRAPGRRRLPALLPLPPEKHPAKPENTGWCKPGYEGCYNIYIMEEVHSILSAGRGSTKLCQPGGSRIQRIFNYKYPAEYIAGFDTILKRKEGVSRFYAGYLIPKRLVEISLINTAAESAASFVRHCEMEYEGASTRRPARCWPAAATL